MIRLFIVENYFIPGSKITFTQIFFHHGLLAPTGLHLLTFSVLVLQVSSCVVKYGLVTLVIIMILKETTTFHVLFIVSVFCAWNITTVEINSGIYSLKS